MSDSFSPSALLLTFALSKDCLSLPQYSHLPFMSLCSFSIFPLILVSQLLFFPLTLLSCSLISFFPFLYPLQYLSVFIKAHPIFFFFFFAPSRSVQPDTFLSRLAKVSARGTIWGLPTLTLKRRELLVSLLCWWKV